MEKRGISGSTLKIIAVIAMIMDHTAWCILDPLLKQAGVSTKTFLAPLSQISVSPVLCIMSPVFHTIGRITFPIMLFLLVEGVRYSKNRKKYIRNMLIFSFVSEIPFNLAFSKNLFNTGRAVYILEGQNVFVTLTLSLIALVLIDNLFKKENFNKGLKTLSIFGSPAFFLGVSWYFVKRNSQLASEKANYIAVLTVFAITLAAYLIIISKKSKEKREKLNLSLLIAVSFALLTYILDSDYRFMGVIAATVMYLLRENKICSYISGSTYLTANTYLEFGTFLATPFIINYNGKRGLRLKYFFYIVYPGHLLLLWLIRYLLKL